MRTTTEKLALFRRFFMGRTDAYGTYDPQTGKVHQVKAMVTDLVLENHLRGKMPYGFYMLDGDRTTVAVADFDEPGTVLPKEFVRIAQSFGMAAYVERSKAKGHHAWAFFGKPGVSAKCARMVFFSILRQIGCPDVEVFPKQDCIDSSTSYGNFINAPLFYPCVREKKTIFLDGGMEPYPDQWDFLATVQCVSDEVLDQITRQTAVADSSSAKRAEASGDTGGPSFTFGLRPCAQRMLQEGVSANQRIACFRLAIQLRKAGLPEDSTLVVLERWAQKNHPNNGKAILRSEEVQSQVRSAYGCRLYRGCGCQTEIVRSFCDPSCRLNHGTNNGLWDRKEYGE
jgi:hypothetical protein